MPLKKDNSKKVITENIRVIGTIPNIAFLPEKSDSKKKLGGKQNAIKERKK